MKQPRAQRKQQAAQPAPQIIPQPPMVEICRSFSYKLNVGGYESRDFFESRKVQTSWEQAEQVSQDLFEMVRESVMRSVKQYRQLLATQKRKGVSRMKECEDCDGTGMLDGLEPPERCLTCDGSGHILNRGAR